MIKLHQLFQKIIILLGSLLISVLIFELLLIVIDYNYIPLRIKVYNYSDWRYYHIENRCFIYDPYLIWRPKNSCWIYNSQGYLGEEITLNKEPHSFRIFAFGDSNTMDNWPIYLQELSRQSNKKISVVSAGVPGYSSLQGLNRFKEMLLFKPDMVIICFGCNDAHRATIPDTEFINNYHRRTLIKLHLEKILSKFKIGQLIIAFFDRYLPKKEALVPRVSLQEYQHNLNEIIKISKMKNIKVILLTRPFIGKSPNAFWWKNFAPKYNAATIELAKDNDVPVIDIYSYFKDKMDFFSDESHFNQRGHRYMAKIIYENIKALLN